MTTPAATAAAPASARSSPARTRRVSCSARTTRSSSTSTSPRPSTPASSSATPHRSRRPRRPTRTAANDSDDVDVTVTEDVELSRHQDVRQRHRHRRRLAGELHHRGHQQRPVRRRRRGPERPRPGRPHRRLDRRGLASTARPRPVQQVTCSLAHLDAADGPVSITVDYHVATDDRHRPSRSATARPRRPTRTAPAAPTRSTSSRTSSSRATKTFDSRHRHRRRRSPRRFTIDVTNNGVSDADDVTHHRHGRRPPGRRLDRRRVRTPAPRRPSSCRAASTTSPPARPSSITVHYHVASTTDSAPGVGNTASAASDEDTAADATDTVDIVEDVVLTVVKTFADDAIDAGTAGHTFSLERPQRRRLRCRRRRPVRHRRSAPRRERHVRRRLRLPRRRQQPPDDHLQPGPPRRRRDRRPDGDLWGRLHDRCRSVGLEHRLRDLRRAGRPRPPGPTPSAITEDVDLEVVKAFTDDPVTAGDGPHTFTIARDQPRRQRWRRPWS